MVQIKKSFAVDNRRNESEEFGAKFKAGDEFHLHIRLDGVVEYYLNENMLYSSRSVIDRQYKLFVSLRNQILLLQRE